MLDCHFVGGGAREISVRDAAVRADFYADRLADGGRSVEVETAMGKLETLAPRVLSEIEERWPFSDEDVGILAEFIALQMLRSPAWRALHDRLRGEILEGERQEWSHLGEEFWSAHRWTIESDQHRSFLMLHQVPKVGSLIGSMHWTLLRFGTDRLVTSDHPVAPIVGGSGSRGLPGAIPTVGLANVAEFRFPVSPTHALLLSWLDEPAGPPVRGFPQHAQAINGSVCAQAERAWFSRPSSRPASPRTDPVPITWGLFAGHGPQATESSQRRREAVARVNEMIASQERVSELTMVRVRRRGTERPRSARRGGGRSQTGTR